MFQIIAGFSLNPEIEKSFLWRLFFVNLPHIFLFFMEKYGKIEKSFLLN